VILGVDEMNVVGRPLFYVKPLLQGPPGSLVKLRVFRLGAGETTITLVRHLSNNTGGLLSTPDPTAPPVHRLVRWDHQSNAQISEVCPLSKNTPRGYVDILIIDVQNLPVAYEMGWAVSSTLLGSILCNPYVVAKQAPTVLSFPPLSPAGVGGPGAWWVDRGGDCLRSVDSSRPGTLYVLHLPVNVTDISFLSTFIVGGSGRPSEANKRSQRGGSLCGSCPSDVTYCCAVPRRARI